VRALPSSLVLLLAAACAGDADHRGGGDPVDAGGDDATSDPDATVPSDAPPSPDAPADVDAGPPPGAIAPDGAVPGEQLEVDGEVPVSSDAVIRVEVEPGEHVTFFLSFARTDADVELEALRWDGAAAVHLGTTDAGRGLRTLAIFEADRPRTFWARVTVLDGMALDGTLTITRVPFEDGILCASDCDHLLQLPLPIDPEIDGYAITTSTILRYQYGRRDLVMFVRYAGQRAIARGMAPFVPHDFSQWNGETPGNDVGSPRHVSHQRGKDVDISLYGLDGLSTWRSYCTTETTSGGRECIAGTMHDYDGTVNALLFGDFFATGSVKATTRPLPVSTRNVPR
jgi:hypothetical protein